MTGRDAGIDPERVAELLVDLRGPKPGRRGSGYRVSASAVVTAAHVVRDAARVRVRFNAARPGEWLTEGTVSWSDPTVDAAVVTITPRPEDEGQVAPVAFGRVAERDAVVACSAMGFPRFKLRNDPAQQWDDGSPSQYRDSVHAVGTIAVLSNRRQGTLEVLVSPPERDPEPTRSPWEGMSGAAVWSAGRIIGLIAEHHRGDGLGRLAATRVDRWYERLPPTQLNELGTLTGLPAQRSELSDVVPPTVLEVLEAGYIAQVRDIAPERLAGREQELAGLVQFCAGEERYGWWQAGPWAGKSALAAWFVLHPPAGVTVVSFFVTGRLAGQADSDAFTEAMIEQLAAVAGEPIAPTATPAGRDRERLRLLDQAATRVGERGGRLLLVVDGLDKDKRAKRGGDKPSVASLLPRRPPDAVRVLIFSRPSPGVPGDVPGDHPLRRCTPRSLAPSPYAEDVRLHSLAVRKGRIRSWSVVAFVVALVAALPVYRALDDNSTPTTSVTSNSTSTTTSTTTIPPPPGNRIATIPVGTSPNAVALDTRAVWVANSGSDNVSRIDPITNKVVATIAVGNSPNGVAVDARAVWVANFKSNSVSRIDPTTNKVVTTIPVGDGPDHIAVEARAVWVANVGSGNLSRIDPTTDKVVETIPLGGTPVEIAVETDAVWVTDQVEGSVYRIDPTTNMVVNTVPVGEDPVGIAVETGAVWVANSSGGKVSRIDPATNEVVDTISLEDDPFAVAVDVREVWATIYGGKVSRIDLSTNRVVETIEVEGGPIAIAVDTRAVWVVNTDNGSVARINRR